MTSLPVLDKSVAFITMGCAKNEVDTYTMSTKLKRAGYTIIDTPEQADVVIVNTCSFIQSATEESIETILDVSQYDSIMSGAGHLVVAGCMPARYGEDLTRELPEARAFVPCSKEDDIVEVLDKLFDITRSSADSDKDVLDEAAPLSMYVKISDGCNRFCSFCSIPYIRGRYHSFTFQDIYANISDLVSRGTKEIVLIAQDTGRWGDDFKEKSSLASLIDRLALVFPTTWFRVMYIQPEGITDELLDVIARRTNVCNYLDIPFQHVNAQVLKRMRRRGSAQEYDELCRHIREKIPDCIIRTTFIVGFPGESDDDFEELCNYVEEADLDYIGIFPYSREEGTRAYDLENQVPEEVKMQRARQLRELADCVCTPRMAARIGSNASVLMLGYDEDGMLYGRTAFQAPDVDGCTFVDRGTPGEVANVTITDSLLYELEASRA